MYSVDLRRLAFRKLQSGCSLREAARHVGVSPSTVHRWRKHSLWSQQRMKRRGSVYDMQRDVFICLQDAIKLAPTATLSELRCMINTDVSLATVHRYVRHLGYSRKRVSSTLMGSPSVDSVERFNQLHSSFVAREALIVSVDECHFSTRLFPRYGYSPVGDPCHLRRKLRVRGDGRSISLQHFQIVDPSG